MNWLSSSNREHNVGRVSTFQSTFVADAVDMDGVLHTKLIIAHS